MKVLHISRTMGQGGAEKIVYQLCRDNSDQEQIVVSCGGVYADKLEQDGIKQYKIPDLDNKNPFIMLKCLAIQLALKHLTHQKVLEWFLNFHS